MILMRMGLCCATVAVATLAAAAEVVATHDLGDVKKSYEVLVPDGTGPFATLLYLHPSGQSDSAAFKKDYWPLLRDRKVAVVLPHSIPEEAPAPPSGSKPKAPPMQIWAAGEETFIMDALADAQRKYPLDDKTVLLMGVSGGGQMALFLADKLPQRWRAVIGVSTNPIVVRGSSSIWFYPNREVLKTCPYFVFNHITQGASLMYWRQVQVKLADQGASISVLPVLGPVSHYLPPPPELTGWLDAVLAGKHPAVLEDPQKAAVAKRYAPVVDELAKRLGEAKPAKPEASVAKNGRRFKLTVPLPAQFLRSAREAVLDAQDNPLTQIQIEHEKWPVYLRHDACSTAAPMAEMLAAEEAQTVARGMLYQVCRTLSLQAGGRTWSVKIGSFTYPDQKRGWVSPLFAYAAAPMGSDPKQWLSVLIWDETQRKELDEQAAEMASLLRSALENMTVGPAEQAASGPTARP
ncbi:MAG: hypothetical protein BWX88_02886 [Planctomycetes bacterium ADurb.Bin126]|nr:MAG: hypothetical protein BWX88_02886 [Planctomycetes bacterium ADurb.Bin126]HOD82714.1 hypothetical protein [Phycisphaerae bacterium]HQL72599.1 hypothetical protein [Phycisphaerae bacterium]